ncbi:MAG TPA: DUF1707 domain-containing protein [Acidimicrobiales bacterium]|nr:DUF1707 domain-containing protein [Acidimicrobiales bacterium]
MRASDEDRQRTVEELRRHCAAGRIDVDEYASRIERALTAATLEELDQLRSDLPMLRIAEPAGRHTRVGGGLAGLLALGDGDGHHRTAAAGPDRRILALGVAAITVIVVLAAIALSLAAEWTWAVVLLAGWAAGVAQGTLVRNRRRPR